MQGVSPAEAGRQVGVSPSTVRRWEDPEAAERQVVRGRERARERAAAAPASVEDLPALAERGRYLSLDERIVIADYWAMNVSQTEIAAMLGRHKSTICRELARHSYIHPSNDVASARRYGPYAADKRAAEQRRRPKARKLEPDSMLWAHVRDRLTERWSPEQIARTLPDVFPDQPDSHVVHETIYQALYLQGRGELRRELAACLRSGRARRRGRGDREARQSRFSEPMVMISERPAEAEDRAVPGHWEGDLIIGQGGRSAIATLVERHSRYLMLAALPGGRDAVTVRDRLVEILGGLPRELARSLTWDQGSEMARHHEFRIATGIPVYFCDPASPWMRGSNENTNGLLRQYFPKGTDLSLHTDADLAAVADEINRRPRKTLGWATPAQRLATVLAQAS
jgi:IS30 family transposase